MDVTAAATGARSRAHTVLQAANKDTQESLQEENEPDPMEGEQTWPTDEELADADVRNSARGTGGGDAAAAEDDVDQHHYGVVNGATGGGDAGEAARRARNPFLRPPRTKRVPKGTSSYQAAWIIDSDSEGEGEGDNDDDDDDEEEDGMSTDAPRAVEDDGDEGEEEEDEEEYEDVVVDEDLNALDTQLTEAEERDQLNAYLSSRGTRTQS